MGGILGRYLGTAVYKSGIWGQYIREVLLGGGGGGGGGVY